MEAHQSETVGMLLVATLLALLLVPLISSFFDSTPVSAAGTNHSEMTSTDDDKPGRGGDTDTSTKGNPTAIESSLQPTVKSDDDAEVDGATQARSDDSFALVAMTESSSSSSSSLSVNESTTTTTAISTIASNWRCVCEDGGSFLPASMLGPMAVLRMGAGQCYHKQT